MKIYSNGHKDDANRRYFKRVTATEWILMAEMADVQGKVRELNGYEANLLESVFQHFAAPLKKLTEVSTEV